MDITVSARKVNVDSNGYKSVSIEIEDIDKEQLLENLKIEDFLDYFGIDKVLDEIGIEECKEHFDLSEIIDED